MQSNKDRLLSMIIHTKDQLKQFVEHQVCNLYCLEFYVALLIIKPNHNLRNGDQLNNTKFKKCNKKLLSKQIENKRDRESTLGFI